MRITALDLRDVRSVAAAALEPGAGLNLIVGPNAAGKTSLLEAIHLLGTGRSFAATRPTRLIRHDAGPLRVVARVQSDRPHGRLHRLGLERDSSGPAVMRIDGANVGRVSDLARLLPVVAVHPDSHELVSGGPGERRRLLDQGLFHVEHSYHDTWQRYRRLLAQRNTLLRMRAARAELGAWEQALAEAGSRIDALRAETVTALNALIQRRAPELVGEDAVIELRYRRGWPEDQTYVEALERAHQRDREHLTTTVGPHRADLALRWNGRDSRQRISRGQQKLLVYLLRLAQAEQMGAATGEGCILLLDDLAAELDAEHRARVVRSALALGVQLFVTAIDARAVPTDPAPAVSMFHVEQGRVEEVIQ
ncbi:MAG: DNA replication/repair protein RecF [Halofilum sp. (in: g-proteobacteria)]|nr:DNA replication/repair protein RecF [Halofilum sp. (in: g-proteobacteria)]